MPVNPFVCEFDGLPQTLPVFPLSGAVVMPGGELPLNIFEPRYLNMVADAMASHRMFGMVQPLPGRQPDPEPLHRTGCAGRITSYRETSDGRILLVLSGVCRFDIQQELRTIRGYRLVVPDWSRFAADYGEPDTVDEADEITLVSVLREYLLQKELNADWEQLRRIRPAHLIDSLVSMLPLEDADKQLLLESVSLAERMRQFSAILAATLPSDLQGTRH